MEVLKDSTQLTYSGARYYTTLYLIKSTFDSKDVAVIFTLVFCTYIEIISNYLKLHDSHFSF